MDKQRIKKLADDFIDWPTEDKTHVTTATMLLFAGFIADMAANDEREACAEAIRARSAPDNANSSIEIIPLPVGCKMCNVATGCDVSC